MRQCLLTADDYNSDISIVIASHCSMSSLSRLSVADIRRARMKRQGTSTLPRIRRGRVIALADELNTVEYARELALEKAGGSKVTRVPFSDTVRRPWYEADISNVAL